MSKMQRNLCGKDRLSSLPDDLRIRILCLTKSYKCAVRCSVLSSRWQDFYKRLPCMYLDEYDLFHGIKDDEDISGREHEHLAERLYKAFQNGTRALTRHQGRLNTLHVLFSRFGSGWDWNDLLQQAINTHTIQHLCWAFQDFGFIPAPVFSCSSLVTLDLLWLSISDSIPDSFGGFPNLRVCNLSLTLTTIGNNDNLFTWVDDFLSRCPVLEHLTLELDLRDLSKAEYNNKTLLISSPSLLCLDMSCYRIRYQLQIRIVAPQLSKMHLRQHRFDDCEDESESVKITIEAPKLVEIVNHDNEFVDLVFHPSGLPKLFERIASADFQGFPNLTQCKIKLFNITCSDKVNEYLNDLLSKCPNLRYLVMTLHFQEDVRHEESRHNNKKGKGSKENEHVWNLTCSSQSLTGLEIQLRGLPPKLYIKVVTPQLLMMELQCQHSDQACKVHLDMEAPKLLDLSMPSYKHVSMDLHGRGFPEPVEGIVNAKWDATDYFLTELVFNDHFQTSTPHGIFRLFKMISRLSTLKFLTISEIQARPTDIWNKLLVNLPNLDALTFIDCTFEKNIKGKKAKRKEIRAYGSSDSESEMISILLQNTPNLRIRCFSAEMKKCEYKDDYTAVLAKLLSP